LPLFSVRLRRSLATSTIARMFLSKLSLTSASRPVSPKYERIWWQSSAKHGSVKATGQTRGPSGASLQGGRPSRKALKRTLFGSLRAARGTADSCPQHARKMHASSMHGFSYTPVEDACILRACGIAPRRHKCDRTFIVPDFENLFPRLRCYDPLHFGPARELVGGHAADHQHPAEHLRSPIFRRGLGCATRSPSSHAGASAKTLRGCEDGRTMLVCGTHIKSLIAADDVDAPHAHAYAILLRLEYRALPSLARTQPNTRTRGLRLLFFSTRNAPKPF